MDDKQAPYGIACLTTGSTGASSPTPELAKERLRLAVFWVSREGDQLIIEVDS